MSGNLFPLDEVQDMINRLEDRFDKRFDKVEDKVDQISEITIKNTLILEEHQRRSLASEKRADLLEEQVELQRKESETAHRGLSEKQKELNDTVELFTNKIPTTIYRMSKWIAAVSGAGAILWGLITFFTSHMVK